MMKEELIKKGVSKDNIFYKKYNGLDIDDTFTASNMYNEIKLAIVNKGRCYLFLDELQEVNGGEKAVNSLLEEDDVDIYVAGSNSKLMGAELSTYLSGRYVLIPVYTLSFKEYLSFKNSNANVKTMFCDYLHFGGFPLIGLNNFSEQSAYQIVDGIFSSIIIEIYQRDIRLETKTCLTEWSNSLLKMLVKLSR